MWKKERGNFGNQNFGISRQEEEIIDLLLRAFDRSKKVGKRKKELTTRINKKGRTRESI